MSRQLVVFKIGARRFGLDLFAVERVTRAVLVTSLPNAPEGVTGVVNVQGKVLPVLDLRLLWCSETAQSHDEIGLNDEFIVVHGTHRTDDQMTRRPVVLWVESVEGVVECASEDWIPLDEVLEGAPDAPQYFQAVVKTCGEIIFVCDPPSILDPAILDSDILDPEEPEPLVAAIAHGESLEEP